MPTDGGTDAGGDGGVTDPVCARVAEETIDGHSVAVCLEAFASPPYVHLPADTDTVVYGGIVHGGPTFGTALRTRSGDLDATSAPWVAGEMMPVPRYGYLLYRVARAGDALSDPVPVVRVDDMVLQHLLDGLVLEGTVSARIPSTPDMPFEFGETLSLPIRIRLDAAPDPAVLDSVAGYPRHAIFGTIENAAASVTGADGSCLASLDSFAERSPLTGTTGGRVFLARHPNMHGGGDDVFTLDWPAGVTSGNNMGPGLFIPTADLILDAAPALEAASSSPHGTPWGGPSAHTTVVTGGGAPCTP